MLGRIWCQLGTCNLQVNATEVIWLGNWGCNEDNQQLGEEIRYGHWALREAANDKTMGVRNLFAKLPISDGIKDGAEFTVHIAEDKVRTSCETYKGRFLLV